jgi:hydrogenase maturation factor
MSRELFELFSGPHCTNPQDGKCITCSDEAVPARIIRIDRATALAEAEIEGEISLIDLSLLDQVVEGDIVLAHARVAFSRVSQNEEVNR